MGYDIELRVERRAADSRWELVPDERIWPVTMGRATEYDGAPFLSRNYLVFTLLAGVGDRGDGVVPIAYPRALPSDTAPETLRDLGDQPDRFSWSWVTVEELLDVDYTVLLRPAGRSCPPTLGEALGQGFFTHLDMLISMSGDGTGADVRLVFCFNN